MLLGPCECISASLIDIIMVEEGEILFGGKIMFYPPQEKALSLTLKGLCLEVRELWHAIKTKKS